MSSVQLVVYTMRYNMPLWAVKKDQFHFQCLVETRLAISNSSQTGCHILVHAPFLLFYVQKFIFDIFEIAAEGTPTSHRTWVVVEFLFAVTPTLYWLEYFNPARHRVFSDESPLSTRGCTVIITPVYFCSSPKAWDERGETGACWALRSD